MATGAVQPAKSDSSGLRIMLPDRKVVTCPAGRPEGVVFGRDTSCDVVLADPSVSGHHLSIFAAGPQGQSWFVTDLNSRHGVKLNGSKIPVGMPTPIRVGDWIGLGQSKLRVEGQDREPASVGSQAMLSDGPASQRDAPSSVVLGMAELQRISRISAARSREELCSELLSCVLAVTGYSRTALAQVSGSEGFAVDLIAARSTSADVRPVESISRSLINLALKGGTAVFDGLSAAGGLSIQQSLIHDACCIRLPGTDPASGMALVLYMDSREREARPRPGAADIASALTNVAAACLGRLSAVELEQRHLSLQNELRGARAIQQMLLPPLKGDLLGGRLRYELSSLPGLVVAGDIVDVVELDADRAAIFIGDVMGKGAPAGMLMSSIQARLSQGLRDGVSLQSLVVQLNRDTCARCPGMMVSLWAGVVSGAAGRLEYIDAGHGLALHRAATGEIAALDSGGGPVLGAEHETTYESAGVDLRRGDRLLLVTDGIPEQPSPQGSLFGLTRVRECFALPGSGLEHLSRLKDAALAHANGMVQRDDMTALVVETTQDLAG